MDYLTTILPIFIVLAISYFLVLRASRDRASPRIEVYLFEGNRPALAISSGVGSIFSLSIAATSLLSGGYLYGWQCILPLATGAWLGIFVWTKLFRTEIAKNFKSNLEAIGFRDGGSFLMMLAQLHGRAFHLPLLTFLMASYSMMLILEISLIKIMLAKIFPFAQAESTLVLLMMLAACYAYVFIGGYRGVLLTDHFQFWTIVLLAAVLGSYLNFPQVASAIPAATKGAIKWSSAIQLIVFHISTLFGGVFFAAGSADQWYRTACTLSFEKSKRVLIASVAIYCVGGTLLVLAGSMAYSSGIRPEGALNQISMDLLVRGVSTASGSLKFSIMLVLTCIVLTTIDTYLITIEQLYHEATGASSKYTTASRWLSFFQWGKIRTFAAIILGVSVLAASLLNQDTVYRYGLAALLAPGFVASILILHAFPQSSRLKTGTLLTGFFLSVIFFPFALWLLAKIQGSLDLHLYVICGSTFLALTFGYLIAGVGSLLHRQIMRRFDS